jgi:hypothetical protein
MSFRNLYTFNRAMLAKQCWRLLSSPESLCARVLRAKYYPTGDLLKAGPKKFLRSLGRVSWKDSKLSKGVTYGELATIQKLISGLITGSLLVYLARW